MSLGWLFGTVDQPVAAPPLSVVLAASASYYARSGGWSNGELAEVADELPGKR